MVTADDTRFLLRSLAASSEHARWRGMVDASRIRTRHSVLPLDEIVRRDSIAERSRDYSRESVRLAAVAATDAIARAGLGPEDIVSVVSVSCTGYMLPSLDAHLIPQLGLDRRVRRLPITELGCSAGVAGLAIARRLQTGDPARCVLLVSVETCSLCLRNHRPRRADLLGSLLFGDGAAAAVIGPARTTEGPSVVAEASVLWEGSAGLLGMELEDQGFHFVLSPSLPGVVRSRVRGAVADFLEGCHLDVRDIGFWIVHPGGPRILRSVAEALGLGDDALRASWSVWERCGNVSSATVFFILREIVACSAIPEGQLGLMLAFGPGVSCEMVLLRAGGWMSKVPYS